MPRNGASFEDASAQRRCPSCGVIAPATRSNFYLVPNTGRLWRCLPCYDAYYAARPERGNRSARRNAGRTTPRSPRVSSSTVLTGSDRRFGVEIEFIGSRGQAVADAMRNNGLSCNVESYNHIVRSGWKIVPDASVRNGMELVSPVLSGEAGREEIRTACKALREAGATTSVSTGLHVHHEVRDFGVREFGRLAEFWCNNQGVIDTMVAQSRRGGRNSLIARLHVTEVSRIKSMRDVTAASIRNTRVSRYKTLNVQSFAKYGTVEIRQHQGTTNAGKILSWIEFGQACITFALSQIDLMTTDTLDTVYASLVLGGGLTIETADFLRRRVGALNSDRRAVAA